MYLRCHTKPISVRNKPEYIKSHELSTILIQNITYHMICKFLEDLFVIWVHTNAYFKLCVCMCEAHLLQNTKHIGESLVFFPHVSEHDEIENNLAFTGQKGKVLHIVQPTSHSKLYSLLAS